VIGLAAVEAAADGDEVEFLFEGEGGAKGGRWRSAHGVEANGRAGGRGRVGGGRAGVWKGVSFEVKGDVSGGGEVSNVAVADGDFLAKFRLEAFQEAVVSFVGGEGGKLGDDADETLVVITDGGGLAAGGEITTGGILAVVVVEGGTKAIHKLFPGGEVVGGVVVDEVKSLTGETSASGGDAVLGGEGGVVEEETLDVDEPVVEGKVGLHAGVNGDVADAKDVGVRDGC
jgi:hypothetical protein